MNHNEYKLEKEGGVELMDLECMILYIAYRMKILGTTVDGKVIFHHGLTSVDRLEKEMERLVAENFLDWDNMDLLELLSDISSELKIEDLPKWNEAVRYMMSLSQVAGIAGSLNLSILYSTVGIGEPLYPPVWWLKAVLKKGDMSLLEPEEYARVTLEQSRSCQMYVTWVNNQQKESGEVILNPALEYQRSMLAPVRPFMYNLSWVSYKTACMLTELRERTFDPFVDMYTG